MRHWTQFFSAFIVTCFFFAGSNASAAEYEVETFEDQTVTEGVDSSVTLTIELDKAVETGDSVIFNISAVPISPASTSDFGTVPGSVTINATEQTATVTIPIVADALPEPEETFKITLTEGTSSATVTNDPVSATVTIQSHLVTLTPSDASALEDAGKIEFEVALDRDLVGSEVVSVDYVIGDGTADSSDYTTTSGTLTFNVGTGRTQSVFADLTDDSVDEPDETIELVLSNPSAGVSLNTSSATGTIVNDDYTMSLAASSMEVAEGDNAEIIVSIGQPAAADNEVVFNVALEDVETTSADYTAPPSTLTIAAGASSGTISIPITDDTLVESAESFKVKITPNSGNMASGEQQVEVTIKVDDTYLVEISSDVEVDVDEDATVYVKVVEPVVEPGHSVTVTYATIDNTAEAGTDYVGVSGDIVITDNNSQPINIDILNDGDQTGAKDFTVKLTDLVTVPTDSSGALASFGDDEATITINDHEFEVNMGNDKTVPEDSTQMTFEVSLDRAPEENEVVTVDFKTVDGSAVAPDDYIAQTGTLTFDKDSGATQEISIEITDDAVQENLEQFTVELDNPSTNVIIGDSEATGSITDEDYYVASFPDIEVSEDAGNAELTVTLNSPVLTDDAVLFTVSYLNGDAEQGSDFTAPDASLEIPAGAQAGTITIPVIDDDLVEFSEKFTITITPSSDNVTVADDSAEVTINVDEQYHFSINDVTQNENSADFEFTITLVSPTPLQTEHNGLQLLANTINGTASAPADFTALTDEPVTFSESANEQPITVTVIADAVDEGAGEDFSVQLTAESTWAPIVAFDDDSGAGIIQDTDYVVIPSWNDGGEITLDLGPISNGAPVGIDSETPAVFTVTADYEIKSVLINGDSHPLYVTVDDPAGELVWTYTFDFEAVTPPTGAYTLEAIFNHQIVMSAGSDGEITYTGDNTSVREGSQDILVTDGEDATFEFAADSGYCVTDLLVDGISQGAFTGDDNLEDDSFTFPSVTTDHQIDVFFGQVNITVEMDVSDGQVDSEADLLIQSASSSAGWRAYRADASFSYDEATDLIKSGKHGDTISIPGDTGTCDSPYIVIQFLDLDGYLKPDAIEIDLSSSFEDITVSGSYDKDSFILTLVLENGSVVLDPAGSPATGTDRYVYAADEVVSLTAVPDPDWFFQNWSQDASGTDAAITITMDGDKTVEPLFVQGCADNDNDGYQTDIGEDCIVSGPVDCDDTDPDINPGKMEICGDGINQNCSELVDGVDLDDICTGIYADDDGDGYTEEQGDCDDTKASVAPGLYDDPNTSDNEDCYDGAKLNGDNPVCEDYSISPSDAPANVAKSPADPMIMFLFDDSGSMAWEFMTRESDGTFDYNYVLDNHPEQAEVHSGYLDTNERLYWASQFSEYNKIYFNPTTVYTPWPKWDEVAANADYATKEKGTVRTTEFDYEGNASFPDNAFVDGYVHADMDEPRYNSIDSNDGHSWSYVENSGYDMTYDLNKTYFSVKLAGAGQKVVISRDSASSGGSTLIDAIGLSTNPNLEQSYGHPQSYYDANTDERPEVIFDGVVDPGSSLSTNATPTTEDFYVESGTWRNSSSSYPWENNARYTQNNGDSGTITLNLTADKAGTYYVYAWVNSYNDRDSNARYDIYYYNDDDELVADSNIREDQSPYNSSHNPTRWGARWIRIGDQAYNFKEQSITGATSVNVPFAHYYTWDDSDGDGVFDFDDTDGDGLFDHKTETPLEDIYLVTIPGSGRTVGSYSLNYYLFTDLNSDAKVQDGELTEVTGSDIPDSIIPQIENETGELITDADELAYAARQNFADWFSFYRTRMQTAKAAVGLTTVDMENVEIGIHTINRSTVFRPISIDTTDSDEMLQFLSELYDIDPSGSTPLRRGLNEVGYYYDASKCTNSSNLEDDYYTCSEDDYTTETSCEAAGESWDWVGNCTATETVYASQEEGGECQKAYVIAMTDGYYNGSFNFSYSSSQATSIENSRNKDILSEYSVLQDGARNSFADIAYYFYEKDLDPSLDDLLPSKNYDNQTAQHMVTYAVSFGVFGWFDPDLFPDCLPEGEPGVGDYPLLADIGTVEHEFVNGQIVYADGDGPFENKCPDWHDFVQTQSAYSVDDLFHGSVNSRGKFLNASDPAELVSSMKAIKDLIDSDTGTASSVAVNANKIQDDTLLYQTVYDSDSWSGDILAKCLDSDGSVASCARVTCESTCKDAYTTCMSFCGIGGNTCEDICVEEYETCLISANCDEELNTDESIVKWSASDELDDVTVDYDASVDERQIITSVLTTVDGETQVKGIAFTWDTINSSMKAVLDGDGDGDGDHELLEYLRGDDRYEAENDTAGTFNFRDRVSKLGDFINSEPYHYENEALGINWVFAGANDGMLHVFDSETGKEIFAYIPNIVFENLPDLADASLTGQHTFFVDGYVTVKDLGDAVVLIGGLRKGGKGFYCLNLTAAAQYKDSIQSNADEIVLWEYSEDTVSNTLAADLGYSFSRPQIIETTAADSDYLFVFGNGYDSENGKAVLFLVGLDSYGTIVSTTTIDTGVGCPDAGACPGLSCSLTDGCNGLSTPAIIYPQGDGNDDFIFAGDLLGNLWKFDIGSSDKSEWGSYFKDGATLMPLFSAQSVSGYQQPITMQPDVSYSCTGSSDGYLVAFGTGRLIDEDDSKNMSIQSVYGIWDWSNAWLEAGMTESEVRKSYLGTFGTGQTGVAGACQDTCRVVYDNGDAVSTCKTDNKDLYCAVSREECITACAGDTDCMETYCSALETSVCETECAGDEDCIDTYCASGDALECLAACAGDTLCEDTYCNARDTETCEESVDYMCEEVAGAGSCINSCNGNTECELDCLDAYNSCYTNCDAIRTLSNLESFIGDTDAADYITLLQQTQVYAGGIIYNSDGTINDQVYGATDIAAYDEIVRTMSDNDINWFNPAEKTEFIADASKTVAHVGWYFDLPGNGERVIQDMTILNGKLIYTSSVPSDSPCESGGRSSYWTVDVCTGGRTSTPFLDLNEDNTINSKDYINIGTEANPIWATASSIDVEGLAPAPTVVEVENQLDRLYFPDEDDDDGLGDSAIQGFGTPIQYWRELDWQ